MKKTALLLLILPLTLLASFSGKIIDKTTLEPLKNVTISDTKHSIKTLKDGTFNINSKENTYFVKACGYRPYQLNASMKSSLIQLEPITIKALYLTFWGASNNSQTLKNILKIAKKTEINAVVVDVKNEYGSTAFLTSFEQANSHGAHKNRTNRNISKFINTMKKNNIYTIARIATFKDEIQASHNPEYAIKNAKGKIWRNHDNMAWVDPYDKRSHEYAITMAEEAAKVGYDEINFDYIRFPAKKGLAYSKEHTQENRVNAIKEFLKTAQERLRKYGVFISVDTYGNICWSKDDNNIGQTIEGLAAYADYLSPMLYPSGFSSGSFYVKYPAKHPYKVVYRSISNIKERIDTKRVRPWLQYFKDYTSSKVKYEKYEINQQIKATKDSNTSGWMMWSPSSKYNKNYFSK